MSICLAFVVALNLQAQDWPGWRGPNGDGSALRVLSSERTDLGRSRAYADCDARHQEAIRFLRSKAQPR